MLGVPQAVHRFVLAAACGALAAASVPSQATPLGQAATEALCARYEAAGHWMQKVVILLSLNEQWHPSGSAMIVRALQDKDARLRAFGLEALLRSDANLLPTIATPQLVDLLVREIGATNNDLWRERATAALQRLVPAVEAADQGAWRRWWSEAQATFAPPAWSPPEQPAANEQQTTAAAQRAFDLYESGLDMLICIDSTGSMQPTIDALGEALADMADIIDGISPKMRLGIVQYKDYGELGRLGAKVVQPFTKNIRAARRELAELRAFGGGDLPEAVRSGLLLAFDPKMKWQPDANKIVVLIGDAPPRAAEQKDILDLVREAREAPGALSGKPAAGQKAAETPFLTSCIGVFVELHGKLREQEGYREFVDSQRKMRDAFEEIAAAGGGIFAEVEFSFTDEPSPEDKAKDKDRRKRDAREAGVAIASAATKRIVEHILVLSFGERFAREMREFVRIFYEYKEAGVIG